jgi:hypothetical protein
MRPESFWANAAGGGRMSVSKTQGYTYLPALLVRSPGCATQGDGSRVCLMGTTNTITIIVTTRCSPVEISCNRRIHGQRAAVPALRDDSLHGVTAGEGPRLKDSGERPGGSPVEWLDESVSSGQMLRFRELCTR